MMFSRASCVCDFSLKDFPLITDVKCLCIHAVMHYLYLYIPDINYLKG